LSKFLVLDHFILDSNQDLFHGVSWIPIFEHGKLIWFNCSILLINARKVNLGVEFDSTSLSWVVISTSDGHHVDSVIEVGVLWTDDSTIPVCETFIIT